jgi:ketosteroid isomerase-like protein
MARPGPNADVLAALATWNDRASHADLDGVMALFDTKSNLLLVGSAPGEVFRGRTAIRAWLSSLLSHNTFSWDLSKARAESNGNTAWVFVDGAMTVTSDKGEVLKTPYRFSGVLVKRHGVWKWTLFHGSIPDRES